MKTPLHWTGESPTTPPKLRSRDRNNHKPPASQTTPTSAIHRRERDPSRYKNIHHVTGCEMQNLAIIILRNYSTNLPKQQTFPWAQPKQCIEYTIIRGGTKAQRRKMTPCRRLTDLQDWVKTCLKTLDAIKMGRKAPTYQATLRQQVTLIWRVIPNFKSLNDGHYITS